MRVRLPLGRSLGFACAFLFALLALLPLRLALDWMRLPERGLTARVAEGSIWLGHLGEARFGPVPLGNVQARLSAFPLLLGRARIAFKGEGEEEALEGAITISRHAFGIDDLTGPLRSAPLFAPLRVSSLALEGVSARYQNGLCVAAEGRVEASLLETPVGVPLGGSLSGTVHCEGAAVLLPLASGSGMEALNLRLFGDGRFEAELAVRLTDPVDAASLTSAGFSPRQDGFYVTRVEGAF